MPRKKEGIPTTKQDYWKKIAPRQIQKKKCGNKLTNASLDSKSLIKYHKECQDKNQDTMAFFQPETCEKGVVQDSYCKLVKEVKPGVFNAVRVGSKAPIVRKVKDKDVVERNKDDFDLQEAGRKILKLSREENANGTPSFECNGKQYMSTPKSILKSLDAACEKQIGRTSIYIPQACKNGKLQKSYCLSFKKYKEELKK